MNNSILEETIRQILEQAGPEVSFIWQGGEPTLMSLPFFENVVKLQQKYGRGQTVGNGLQTNGLLINRAWAKFLSKYKFLIGLSLDGPQHIHDRCRRLRNGRSSWAQVIDRAKLLLDSDVAVNVLTVLNDYSVQFPEEIYDFLKSLGLTYMQFIPCLEKDKAVSSQPAPFSASPKKYGEFLCKVFELWRKDFVEGHPTTSVRYFDSLFYTYVGLPAPDCTLLDECGVYVVVEHNGDVYACDFFVSPEWRLGNVMERQLIDLLNSRRQGEFGEEKAALPEACRQCVWLEKCRGNCPKDRFFHPLDKGLNYFCESYKMFLEHADVELKKLASDWKRHQANLSSKFEQKIRPNDYCLCGSGLKYKNCCGKKPD
jgi:uncharacterized protein